MIAVIKYKTPVTITGFNGSIEKEVYARLDKWSVIEDGYFAEGEYYEIVNGTEKRLTGAGKNGDGLINESLTNEQVDQLYDLVTPTHPEGTTKSEKDTLEIAFGFMAMVGSAGHYGKGSDDLEIVKMKS